jgi:hypothetical protein
MHPDEARRLMAISDSLLAAVGEYQGESWIGLQWDDDSMPEDRLSWLVDTVDNLGLSRTLNEVLSSTLRHNDRQGDVPPWARRQANELRSKLWSYVLYPEQYPEPVITESAVSLVESEATPAIIINPLQAAARGVYRAGDTNVRRESSAAVAESLRIELNELVDRTGKLPATYYAHKNAKEILAAIAPDDLQNISQMSHGLAMRILVNMTMDYANQHVFKSKSIPARNAHAFRSGAIVGLLYYNGLRNSEISERADVGVDRSDFVWTRRRFVGKLKSVDRGGTLALYSHLEEASSPSVVAVLRESSPAIEEKIGPQIDEYITAYATNSVISPERRNLLKAIFPDQSGALDSITYEQLKPMLLAMAKAYIAARELYPTKQTHAMQLRDAAIFVDYFCGKTFTTIASENNLSISGVADTCSRLASQIRLYDPADRQDMVNMSLGIAADHITVSGSRTPPHNVVGIKSDTPINVTDYMKHRRKGQSTSKTPIKQKSESRKVAALPRNPTNHDRIKPAPKPTPEAKPTPNAREADPPEIDVSEAIRAWSGESPLDADSINQILKLGVTARLRLSPAERELLDLIAPPKAFSKRIQRLPNSLDALSMRAKYRHLSEEQLREHIHGVVDKIKAINHQ